MVDDAALLKWNESIPTGHYLVTGVPGSGKSRLLVNRAKYLVQKYPTHQHYIIVKYDESRQYLQTLLNDHHTDLSQIHLMTFFEFALKIANITTPPPVEDVHWYEILLPLIALKKVKPICHTVLIDDYEEFKDNWIRLCLNSIIPHEEVKKNGQKIMLKDIILFGDLLQTTHAIETYAWSHIGLNMRGRSEFLQISYRNTNKRFVTALKFLELDPRLESDVKKYYSFKKTKRRSIHTLNEVSEVQFLFKDEELIQTLERVRERFTKLEDILILSLTGSETYLNVQANKLEDLKWQRPKVIFLIHVQQYLIEDDSINRRKNFYKALTRGSEGVYVHALFNSKISYANQLEQCTMLVNESEAFAYSPTT